MAAATLAEAEARTPAVADSMGPAAPIPVDTVAVMVADTMADFTVGIPAAPMAAADLLPAHMALLEPGAADMAPPAPPPHNVRGRGKVTHLATFPPDGISSIPPVLATRLTPQPHQPDLRHLRLRLDLPSPP